MARPYTMVNYECGMLIEYGFIIQRSAFNINIDAAFNRSVLCGLGAGGPNRDRIARSLDCGGWAGLAGLYLPVCIRTLAPGDGIGPGGRFWGVECLPGSPAVEVSSGVKMDNPLHPFELHPFGQLSLFGLDISLNQAVIMMWVVVAVVAGLLIVAGTSKRLVPTK